MEEEDVAGAAGALPVGLDARKRLWTASSAGQPFGQTLEVLRDLRGVSRRQLEALSGRSYSQLRGLELGDRWPSDKTLTSIASHLGYTASDLMGLRDDLLIALSDRSSREVALRHWLASVPARRDLPLTGEVDVDRVDVVWQDNGRTVASFEVKWSGEGKPQVFASATGIAMEAAWARLRRSAKDLALSRHDMVVMAPGGDILVDFKRGDMGLRSLIADLSDAEAALVTAFVRGVIAARALQQETGPAGGADEGSSPRSDPER